MKSHLPRLRPLCTAVRSLPCSHLADTAKKITKRLSSSLPARLSIALVCALVAAAPAHAAIDFVADFEGTANPIYDLFDNDNLKLADYGSKGDGWFSSDYAWANGTGPALAGIKYADFAQDGGSGARIRSMAYVITDNKATKGVVTGSIDVRHQSLFWGAKVWGVRDSDPATPGIQWDGFFDLTGGTTLGVGPLRVLDLNDYANLDANYGGTGANLYNGSNIVDLGATFSALGADTSSATWRTLTFSYDLGTTGYDMIVIEFAQQNGNNGLDNLVMGNTSGTGGTPGTGQGASDVTVAFTGTGTFPGGETFLAAVVPDVTVTLGFTIGYNGVISLDASTNHPSGTFADIVNGWDNPNVGAVTDTALFGKQFTLIGSAAGGEGCLSFTGLGGGGLGIQSEDSNRVDGLNYGANGTISTPETLFWTLDAPLDLAIDLRTWSFLNGAGGDMRVSSSVTNRDFPDISTAAGSFALDSMQLGHGDYLTFGEIPTVGQTSGAAIAGFSFTVVSRVVPSPPRGSIFCERWENTTFYSTHDLVANTRFYGSPDMSANEVPTASNFLYAGTYGSARTRGWITIPVTGKYRFWLSARSGAQLLLSEVGGKYAKRVIAELNPEVGTGTGMPRDTENLWDAHVSQMSEEIHLTAGQTYYLETVQTNGHGRLPHASIAWARPGMPRTPMDYAFVHPYTPTADDADDDYLPDAWETLHGLNPADNGLADITRQGERGDFDGDSLANREEYLLGTDPANPDTDGDGLSDFDEIHSYGTDPAVSDAPSGLVVGTLDLTTYTTTGSPWTLTSQGLIPPAFRGSISWNFSVPGDGFWLLDVATTLLGDLYLQESVDFRVLIDGIPMALQTLHYGNSREALLRIFTPYLTAGGHTLVLEINNTVTRRMVGIRSINVIQPQGADLNQDGIPDWVATQIFGENTLTPPAAASRTSPVCLEGSARVRTLTTLNGALVTPGLDLSHWYAALPLDPSAPADYLLSFETGFSQTGAIVWQPTNIFAAETLIIRKGDSLMLTAQLLTGSTGEAVTLTFGPEGWDGTPGASGTSQIQLASDLDHHIHTLTAAGTYKVRATRPDGTTALATVIVRQADFPQAPKDLFASVPGTLIFPTAAVSPALYFEGGESLRVVNPCTFTNGANGTLTIQTYPERTGAYNMIARLHQGGPILGTRPLHGMGLSDVLQNNSSFVYASNDFSGYNVLRAPITITDFPAGTTLVVTIFRPGVSFLDGSKTLTLTAADFDSNGTYNLEFLFSADLDGGYCHYIDIYAPDGAYLGRR